MKDAASILPGVDPQRYFSIPHEGQFIRGTCYFASAGDLKRRPVVIMIHGFAGQRTEHAFMFVSMARALNQVGIHAVTFDFRGSGEADGCFEEILPTRQLDDIAAVMRWTGGQTFCERHRMGLLGFSIGGLFACCSLIQSPQPKAIALLAPTTIDNFMRFNVPKEDGSVTFGPHQFHPDYFQNLQTLEPEAAIRSHSPASLILQGDADTRVPPQVSQTFHDWFAEHGSIPVHELIPGADHGFNRKSYRQIIDRQTASFFQSSL